MAEVRVKRVYDGVEADDGVRVLVDRLWPRGVSREEFPEGSWLPELAPSTELRKWYDHDVDRFDEFCERYRAELSDNPATSELLAAGDTVTLVTATKDLEHSNAAVLADFLLDHRNG